MDLGTSPGLVLALGLLVACTSCGAKDDVRPTCLSQIDIAGCTPLYPAEFPVIFRQVFGVTCATAGASCHGDLGRQGGLVFTTEDGAYAALLGLGGGKPRVMAGDPACSEMMVRLDLAGHAWSMPPGAPLDESARCSIRRWIQNGALATPAAGP